MFDEDFDGHKLMFHPERVAEWRSTGWTSGPIYTEIELASCCNCRCMFCGVDHMVETPGEFLDTTNARRIIDDLHALGNRSIMFAGHGESLLHPGAADIITYSAARMRTSVTTNGLPLKRDNAHLVDGLSWIRFSINAGDAATYARVHATRPDQFDRALEAVGIAIERKHSLGLDLVVGVQLVLLDENRETVQDLARRARELGTDYFSVKPYSPHPLSLNHLSPDYSGIRDIEAQLRMLEDERFRVVFRGASFARLHEKRPFRTCFGTHFLCFIDSRGDVWECNVFAGDPRFHVGSLRDSSLSEVWASDRRREVVTLVEQLDVDHCRHVCRLEACNRYLWRLVHPWPEDAFI